MTDEPSDLVDSWVAKNKPSYPIAILKDKKFEDFLGVRFFPTGAVIDPEGKLLYAGSVGELSGPLGDAMSEAEKGPLYPKVLAKAVKYLRAGDLDKSYGELLKLLESGKVEEADLAAVTRFREYLEGLAAAALQDGKKLFDEGFVLRSVREIEPYAESQPPFPATAECRAFLTRLEELPAFKAEMRGGELYAEAEALKDSMEFTDAVKAYKSVYKKYDGTLIAEKARNEVDELVKKGMPGYAPYCDSCRSDGRACRKHREEVKP